MLASYCCGATRPSGPTASRATRTQACSTTRARTGRSAGKTRGDRRGRRLRDHTRVGQGHHTCVGPARRRRAIDMCSGDSCVPGSDGVAASHAPAWAPLWDRNRACEACSRSGMISCSLYGRLSAEAAGSCHPLCKSLGSPRSESWGGSKAARRAGHCFPNCTSSQALGAVHSTGETRLVLPGRPVVVLFLGLAVLEM